VNPVTKDELIEILLQKLNEQAATIDELHRIIDNLQHTIESLHQTIDEQNQTIKELTEKLGMNSRNSSKPPSSDGLSKPAPKSLRKPSGKKPGGQNGHHGNHLDIMAEPDEIMIHEPSVCNSCPDHDICISRACVGETRKIIDINVAINVTAHQSLVVNCPMNGEQRKGEFPDNIKAPVQYGENLQALAVSLNTVGAVSVNRTHEILSGVFSIPISTGTISNMVGKCAGGITGVLEWIRQRLALSSLIQNDETGTRVDGKTIWVHCASNAWYTHLTINEHRGKDGMDAGGILPDFIGISVHDCWAPYWKYPNIFHALCCAHLLRELIGIIENYPEQLWASDFKELLLEMKKAKEEAIAAGEWRLSKEQLEQFERRYEKIIKRAYLENPLQKTTEKKRGRQKKGKTLSLIERLDKHRVSVCLFIYIFEVPFDNNLAERDLRMVKTKSKVSGCFRSFVGAQNYLSIMSYVGTAKKHGISAYEAIRNAISGKPGFFIATGN